MAKEPNAAEKKEAAAKKRKAASVKPREAVAGQQNLCTVAIAVQTQISVTTAAAFSEIVIEWGCLGLSEEPDRVQETSANERLLDPKRPITTSEEGLHMYFDPPLRGAGTYGFQLLCVYNEAAEVRDAQPVATPVAA